MIIKLKEAIWLKNQRQIESNYENRIPEPETANLIGTTIGLGKLVFPNCEYGTQAKNIHRLLNEDIKTINLEVLKKLCSILGVDDNFILGTPSTHDKDYERFKSSSNT